MMKYFRPEEFQGQFDLVDPSVLGRLDEFRELWGAPVRISPAPGAVARHGGKSTSQHNVDRWGKTRAIDCFPEGMTTRADVNRAVQIAEEVGFTGVGVYPMWEPSPGLHLDTRPGDRVAKWGAWEDENGNQTYGGIGTALAMAKM